ncbi:hypothetical protein L211DRAFT_563118 [Terfezia boudieri ATCC MYA-4762]|uniref:Uncharacterized protein n=1 Tax=Terfezia boudieri ATCC MYA-4762 TaxID=1051890 RepID=A0A3N4LXY4_9PEZI|nr:hypothetical protein L211DRAFT_563118 [Terfezia boudieri ATCC MYA-4762]
MFEQSRKPIQWRKTLCPLSIDTRQDVEASAHTQVASNSIVRQVYFHTVPCPILSAIRVLSPVPPLPQACRALPQCVDISVLDCPTFNSSAVPIPSPASARQYLNKAPERCTMHAKPCKECTLRVFINIGLEHINIMPTRTGIMGKIPVGSNDFLHC